MGDLQSGPATRGVAPVVRGPLVRRFRQILLWPVHVIAGANIGDDADVADLLCGRDGEGPWHEVDDEFGEPAQFQERHYYEFVSFLPPVQRFLYGQGVGRSVRHGYGESPITVLRRHDVAGLRVRLAAAGEPLTFAIAHIDFYLFYDTDVAMLVVEIAADDLPLDTVQEVMLRVGRAYPGRWNADGSGVNCPHRVEWLGADGAILAVSDYENRDKFLRFVCAHRAPAVAAHWERVLQPMVLHYSDHDAALRVRQLEYYRMPMMSFLAFDDHRAISERDLSALVYATGAQNGERDPEAERALVAVEIEGPGARVHGDDGRHPYAPPRHFATGRTFLAVGSVLDGEFIDPERGSLGRFRHQHFLVFLIAHFHRAALLRFSDRLAAAVSRLRAGDHARERVFRREIRSSLESFLRFSHRYWFHDVSGQALARALFDQCRRQLGIEQQYGEVRQELEDMSTYLESERQARQNASMVRLTVVTTFGLIGTVTTGFLGMNILAWSDESPVARVLIFLAVFLPTALLTLYTVSLSPRLSGFLDSLSDEAAPLRKKLFAARLVWRRTNNSRD
jgi:hypothetical protein